MCVCVCVWQAQGLVMIFFKSLDYSKNKHKGGISNVKFSYTFSK